MNISPLDIRKHEFKKTMRGYDPDEVMAFLDLISIEFENMIRDNSQMKERAASIDSQLKKYHDIESTLRETLLSAQRAREETINTAKKHADVIIREAEVKAASIVEDGRQELTRLRNEFTELRVQKENYFTKIKALVNTQLEILGNLDFQEEAALNKFTSVPEGVSDVTEATEKPEMSGANPLEPPKGNETKREETNGENTLF